jgi:flagellar capping protein FliD
MSEKEIELWEEKAKSGTLRSDSIITSGLSKMRQDLYGPVSGIMSEFNQLAAIGITTSSNYLDKGKLEINVDKLKKALSEDPNAVYELFNKDGTTAAEQGIGKRLRSTIKATMTDIEKKAGKSYSVNNSFVLGRNLDDLDKQISKFEAKLIQVEDRYWRQFTAMEKAIQRANEQSVYLMQQFGGGS